MTARAIARGLRTNVLEHDVLHSLKDHVGRSVAVGTGLPFGENLAVAPAGSAAARPGEGGRVKGPVTLRTHQARCERAVFAVFPTVVGRKLVVDRRRRINRRRTRVEHQQQTRGGESLP